MKVTAVLPAFNAEKTLRKTYEAIPKDHVHEVILVDDASSDNTIAHAEAIKELKVILHKRNGGYGRNQKTCYSEALKRGADIVIMIHPDFQYDPQCVPEMIQPIISGNADMVIGSRFLREDPRKSGMVWWRFWGNRFLTTVQNFSLGSKLSECHSGYRAYNKQLLSKIPYQRFPDGFAFDSEMLTAVVRRKLRITEVPIPTSYTKESSSISFWTSMRYGIDTLKSLLHRY